MSTLRINSIRALNGTDFVPFNLQYGAKAIVQFDGVGGVNEIEYSQNISSVTDSGTGQYKMYYTSQFTASYDTAGVLCSDRNATPVVSGGSGFVSTYNYLNSFARTYNYSGWGDVGMHGIVYGDLV
jgi:hypothetical protein